MSAPQAQFETLCEAMSDRFDGVGPGKMMSSPAIQYQGKVFAFFHKDAMTFKLGKGYDPSIHGVKAFTHLSPFKHKPPMTAWFCIEAAEANLWPTLAEIALEQLQK